MLVSHLHTHFPQCSAHQAPPRRPLRLTAQLAFPGLRAAKPSHDAIRIERGNPLLLRAPDVNIVHQQRTIPSTMQTELQLLQNLGAFKRQAALSDGEGSLMSLLPSSMYNTRRGYALAQWLLQDVQYVANILSTLLGHTRIVATLALVNTNVCPRLHADYVTVRALCTYFGQGTEFAANKGVERRRLQRLLFSDTNGYGMKPSGSMQQASAGDLLFLKGHAYPGNSGCGAVHRSPPASLEAPRLVLTLDEMQNCSCSDPNCLV